MNSTESIRWPTAEMIESVCPPAPGYHLEVLAQETVPELISALQEWQPAWSVGAASVYVREDYYKNHVYLEGGPQKDVFVVLFRHGNELAGMAAQERIVDALALYGSLVALAPAHRGGKALWGNGDFYEELAKLMGLEYIYTLSSLKHRGSQRYMESHGYKPIGFALGYDREEIAPGVIKRVIEVGYSKCLVDSDEMLTPDVANMTPEVRRLYEFIFATPANPSTA